MGTLWQFESDGTHYSVRNSGASIRLYTNRVFHSQWNPRKPFAGGIWDCLSLPALYPKSWKDQRVLLLGVGGGAVIQQLKRLNVIGDLSAVEIDKFHLTIARQWFGVDDEDVLLVNDDAIDWLQRYTAAPFDMIVDDLFGHEAGEPVRACDLDTQWLATLHSHLASDGIAVINCINERQLAAAVPCFNEAGFRYGYRWSLPAYENVIAVLSSACLHPRQWSRNLEISDLNSTAQHQARRIIRRPIRGLGR